MIIEVNEAELSLLTRGLRELARDQFERADNNPAAGRKRDQIATANAALVLRGRLAN